MTTGKPRYLRQGTFVENVLSGRAGPSDPFTKDVKRKISKFLPSRAGRKDSEEIDAFVEAIISEARWALAETNEISLRLKKKDLQAEVTQLLNNLKRTENSLRRMSRDVERMLHAGPNPLEVADQLVQLIPMVEQASHSIASLRRGRVTRRFANRNIAIEAAIRCLRAAKEYGLTISATGTTDNPDSFSTAARLMRVVGAPAGLKFELSTWRNLIGEAKKLAPDL